MKPDSYHFPVYFVDEDFTFDDEGNIVDNRKFGQIWMKHVEPKHREHYEEKWDFPHASITEHKERFIVFFNTYGKGQQYERNVAERDDFLKTLQAR